MRTNTDNIDPNTVADFGREWRRFDQSIVGPEEHARLFHEYFSIFPWDSLPANPVGFDAGCGSGRWAALVARRVGRLHCIDAGALTLDVARRNLGGEHNVVFHEASISTMPFADASMDFGYSLGVLHHLPDPPAGLAECVRKLKPGAPMLVYIYYALDNRPAWFRALWRGSDYMRRAVSKMPFRLRAVIADLSAASIYWPLARSAQLAKRLGFDIAKWPLGAYSSRSYYTMRTDALDRFGTRLEHRMTRAEIKAMMESAGLRDIRFSESLPYWCAVGFRV
jgi:ubiquinone/menaquinone biosynthesis C-methylase UbiE